VFLVVGLIAHSSIIVTASVEVAQMADEKVRTLTRESTGRISVVVARLNGISAHAAVLARIVCACHLCNVTTPTDSK